MAKDYASNNDIKILSDFGQPFTGQLGITASTGSIFINEDNGRLYTQTLGPTADNWVEIINTSTSVGATNGVTLDGNDIVLGGRLSQAGATITQFSSPTSPYTLILKDETFYTRQGFSGSSLQNPVDIFRTDTYTTSGKGTYTASLIRIGGSESIPNNVFYVSGTGGTSTGWYVLSDQDNDNSADVIVNANSITLNTYFPNSTSVADITLAPNTSTFGRTEFVGGTSDYIAQFTGIDINNQQVRIRGEFDPDGSGGFNTEIDVDLGERQFGIQISKANTGLNLTTAAGIYITQANLTGTTITNYYDLYLGGSFGEASITNKYGVYQNSTDSENVFRSVIKTSGGLAEQGSVGTLNSSNPNISNVSVWKITTTTASTATLPDGEYDGQNLTVYMLSASGGITVTPTTTPANWVSFRFDTTGESVDLIWDAGAGWILKGYSIGTVINT